MRLMHLSDLHLGKKVCEFSMLEDQRYILHQILGLVETECADAVLISGDVYDKSVPPAEAVLLFDDFLTDLVDRGIPVFIISGNHDSAARLNFGSRIMGRSRVEIAGRFPGIPEPVILEDAYGPVYLYLLPFIRPADIRRRYLQEDSDAEEPGASGTNGSPDENREADVHSYQEAVKFVMDRLHPDPSVRSVLLAHQFVTGAVRSESEEIFVGGQDNVDVSLFDGFDYAALGHIHRPQKIGREGVRYCGTPLKYSFSEAGDQKSVTIAELREKGNLTVETHPLHPLHDLREVRGSYAELTDRAHYKETAVDDYLHITLTDEQDIPDVMNRLRTIYPNIMKLDYDNLRTAASGSPEADAEAVRRSPLELLDEFYEQQNNQPMNDAQRGYANKLIRRIWGKESCDR